MPRTKYITTDPDTGDPIPLTPERAALVADNLPIAIWAVTDKYASIARQLHDHDEAISIAWEAMVEAARRYDPTSGREYTTYATSYIRAYLLDAVGTRGVISRRTPNGYESLPCASLNATANDDGARRISHGDLIPDHRGQCEAMHPDEADALNHAMRHLDARTRHVVQRIHCEGWTAKEVGREIGVSGTRAQQMRVAGMARLRASMGVVAARLPKGRQGYRRATGSKRRKAG